MFRNDSQANAPLPGAKVLLVSNDPEAAGFWGFGLQQMGIACSLASSAAEALDAWARDPCDLVVIDVCGPELDGIELTRQLRAQAVNPILLFTPSREEAHLLDAYRAGVDECVVKPVSPSLFLAKIRAWLRRSWTIPAQSLPNMEVGDLRLDPERRALSDGRGAVVRLTNLEFRVLYLLMNRPGQVLPADLIVERVWGFAGIGDAVLLKNVVYRLRRKIEPDPNQPRYLQTEGRQGYVFYPT